MAPAQYSWNAANPHAKRLYIRDPVIANEQVALLSSPVGFDLEWKPTFAKGAPENPVALIQLATRDTVLLIQVSAMQEFPIKLHEFLENSDIIKAGVGIQYDVKKLYKDYHISTRNCIDLALLARTVDNAQWKGKYSQPIGLATLVEKYEGLALQKGRITRSNWEALLTPAQEDYASNDAHAGYALCAKLLDMAQSMETLPKASYYTFDSVRGRLCEPSGMQWYPYNPDYDPGPPPPPKEPRPPRASDIAIDGISSIQYSGPSSVHSNRYPPDGRRFVSTTTPSTSAQIPRTHPNPSRGFRGRSPYSRPHFRSQQPPTYRSNYASPNYSGSTFQEYTQHSDYVDSTASLMGLEDSLPRKRRS